MKKSFSKVACALVLALTGTACSHDMPEAPVTPIPNNPPGTLDPVSYAEKTLGVTIDRNQNWVLSRQYSVTVKADAPLQNIQKVQVLDGNPYLQSSTVLAESSIANGDTKQLTFRTPLSDKLLYAACLNADGDLVSVAFTAGDGNVNFKRATTQKQITRGMADDAETLEHPDHVTWNRPDFPDLVKEAHLFLPEGQNNRKQVEALNNHSIETDEFGSVITLIYLDGHKDNQKTRIGYRIYPKDDPDDVQTYIIGDDFDPTDYVLKDETKTPVNYSWQGISLGYRKRDGNVSYEIPYDMHIDFFVVRDGQDLSDDLTRCTVYTVNGHVYLSCEDSSDDFFTDKMFYIWGDVINVPDAPVDIKPVEPQTWTYAWEDREYGDYDLNDCVIEVQENADDNTKLDVTLVALGATRNLWLGFENKSAQSYKDYIPVFDKELHEVLGVQAGTMVNTGRATANPVTVTVSKPAGFDFQNHSFVLGAQTEDGTKQYYAIHIATQGQDPHGIVIPDKWEWPTETTAITAAYPKFAEWAKDIKDEKAYDWYKSPVSGKVIRRQQ